MRSYSVSIWTVRPGREDEFVERWRELAAITARTMVGRKEQSRLLRDRDQPNRFISMAEWDSAGVLRAWRAGPEFRLALDRMREVLDEFSPMTLDDVTKR